MKQTDLSAAKPYLKSSELAELFGVNPATVSLWVKKGKLHPVKKPGRNLRFRRAEIEAFVIESKPAPAERRASPRFSVDYPATVQIDTGADPLIFCAAVIDISAQGLSVAVQGDGEFLAGVGQTTVVVVSGLPQRLFRESVTGRVMRVHRAANNRVCLGLSLVAG